MLLTKEQKTDLVNKIVTAAQVILSEEGVQKTDPDTGFVHKECRKAGFVLVEHQHQKLAGGGTIKTNGLDLWQIEEGNARKLLNVNYVPFEIRFFYRSGKAPWIGTFLNLAAADAS